MSENWLIFVDTNVYLDFYRQSGQSAKRQMEALERHKERLIITEQIRMEFLKNRQKVIFKSFEAIKKPVKTSVPQILTGSEPARLLNKCEKEAEKRYKQLKDRVVKILGDPGNYDDVFKAFNRIFASDTGYNLKRPDKRRFGIRTKARKRFSLGYPPRKPDDNSIGDAVNWEWIMDCAKNSPANQHILIVSRDGDFGSKFGDKSYLNDWLYREFKDRISSKRRIELTTKLTDALRKLDEIVTAEDEEAERKLLEENEPIVALDVVRYLNRRQANRTLPDPRMERILDGMLSGRDSLEE